MLVYKFNMMIVVGVLITWILCCLSSLEQKKTYKKGHKQKKLCKYEIIFTLLFSCILIFIEFYWLVYELNTQIINIDFIRKFLWKLYSKYSCWADRICLKNQVKLLNFSIHLTFNSFQTVFYIHLKILFF